MRKSLLCLISRLCAHDRKFLFNLVVDSIPTPSAASLHDNLSPILDRLRSRVEDQVQHGVHEFPSGTDLRRKGPVLDESERFLPVSLTQCHISRRHDYVLLFQLSDKNEVVLILLSDEQWIHAVD